MQNEMELSDREYPVLSRINCPDDLKELTPPELNALAKEMRAFLIRRVTENGGHLASNLGVVELTIAIHRIFSSPHDHIIFDVGHQSYVHKLLTGRRDRFDTLRQSGGISGFPKRSESEHDCFGTGHSSTSLSAALGFAEADHLSGSDAYTICVLGDGAYTGGMIHEALNNCRKDLRLIIILNENEMSISRNIGRFAKSLARLRASRGYIRTKNAIGSFLRHVPLIGKWIFNRMLRIKMGIKSVVYRSNLFEDLGLFYLGPADGNREEVVETLLRDAKECKQSCIIHLITKKGKGYAPAEETPDRFHGMAPSATPRQNGKTFSEEMGDTLAAMANGDDRICAITAAMASGTGLNRFQRVHPDRFYDVGIAEEHAVTFAAGLAANGYKPAVAIYSTFLQRAYDNIVHDVALQHLPVVFFVDRAGINFSDGPTHTGVFDVAFLSEIPGIRIYTPITLCALRAAMSEAFRSCGPVAIRYPNAREDPDVCNRFYREDDFAPMGLKSDFAPEDGIDAVILTHGRMVRVAMRAQKQLEEQGIRVGILLLEVLAPYEETAERVCEFLPAAPCGVLFLEEEIRRGGMGMLLSDALSGMERMKNKKTKILALDDPFRTPDAGQTCLEAAGLDERSVCEAIRALVFGDNGNAE